MIKEFIVALNKDITEDHAEKLMSVIKMLDGVSNVAQNTTVGDFSNREQIRYQMKEKLFEALKE